MGEIVSFPSRDRACRPVAAAGGDSDERWRILDQVELPGEPFVDGRPQRGVIERLMLDGITGMFWVRLTGGPRGGTTLVVARDKIRSIPCAAPPLSHGEAPSGVRPFQD